MDEPLPVGLGLRVPPPSQTTPASTISFQAQPTLYYVNNSVVPAPTVPRKINISEDGLCEFDELDLIQVRLYNYVLVKDHPESPIR